MNKKDRQIHQMLTAVASLIGGNVSLFPKSSSKIQETFASEVKDLDGLAADYEAAETALRVAGRARDAALETLKSEEAQQTPTAPEPQQPSPPATIATAAA